MLGMMRSNDTGLLSTLLVSTLAATALALHGCGSTSGSDTTAPPIPDAGLEPDAGEEPFDAGLEFDAGEKPDAGEEPDAGPEGPEPFIPGTHPRFDPSSADVPFHSDLVFAAAAQSDGTANIESPRGSVGTTLSQLDGFSTSAFFDILISGSVDPTTAKAGESVLLLELDSGGKDALSLANVVGAVGLANYDVVVVSLDGATNNAVRIRPLKPLKAKTKYLVALTHDLKDAAGERLTHAAAYHALRDAESPVSEALSPVRAAIRAWETEASKFLVTESGGQLSEAAARASLILTYTFTTTDPVSPLIAMAAPRATIAAAQIAAGVAPSTAVENAVALEANSALPTPRRRPLGLAAATGIDFSNFSVQLEANAGKVYTGYITLPYYQSVAAGLPFGEHLARSWKPDRVLHDSIGVSVPADVDGTYNVTYRHPFAAKTADESVPLQVTLPEGAWIPGYAGAANCGQIYGATGYPVVLYVHGLMSDRASVLALAHTLARRCIATVSIDLPLHGIPANSALVDVLNVEKSESLSFSALYGADAPHERHFNVAGSVGAPAEMNFDTPGASDGAGVHFINHASLTNTRDNLRQAVMDLLNLNASLDGINEALLLEKPLGLDTNRLYVVGVSLGGAVASVFSTVNQLAIANDAQLGLAAALHPIRGLVASAAGTQISQLLVNSENLAPVTQAALALEGVAVGTSDYERFLYTAQSALDCADPVSFVATLANLGVPVLVQQVNGDKVIPNAPAQAPLAGTGSMISLLGATQLGLGSTQLGRGYVAHTAGGNSSLLRPEGDAPQVTAEMQTQVVTLVLNNGGVAVGGAAPGNIEIP